MSTGVFRSCFFSVLFLELADLKSRERRSESETEPRDESDLSGDLTLHRQCAEQQLRVSRMESRSLLLEGLPDDFHRLKPKLELYFRNKRRSGGEILNLREHEEDRRKALLDYSQEEDLQKVLDTRVHTVRFRGYGAVELTVKLPEQKNRPAALQTPEDRLLHKVSAVQTETAVTDHTDRDCETPDVLISSSRSLDKETLQMYIEQFTEHFELAKHGNNSWILKLYSQSDLEKIVSRDEHEFGLSVAVHTVSDRAEAWDPHRFILTGFDGTTECDLISVFIGSCSRTTTHCWEPLDEGRVIVSFRQDIDVNSFMKKCTSKQLQGRDIGVTRMERTDSVLLRGDLEPLSEDILTIYFNNKKRSGGGETEAFIWINRRNSAVLTFTNADDAHAVVEQKHSVSGTDVQASLFYSSLQKALTGEKPNLTEIRTKLKIPVSEDLLRFWESDERSRKQLESEAERLHAKVLMDSRAAAGLITLEMNISINTLAALHIAPYWETRASKGIEAILSRFDSAELSVEMEVWRRVEDACRRCITADTALSYSENRSAVAIAGEKDQVRIISGQIRVLVENAVAELEQERNTVQIRLDNRETFELICEHLQADLPQVDLSYDEEQHTVSLRGLKESVDSAQTLIGQAQQSFITHRITLSAALQHFTQSVELGQLERELLSEHTLARLLECKDGLGLVLEKKHLQAAEDRIRQILEEQVIQLSSGQCDEKWMVFLRSLQKESSPSVSITTTDTQITICGFSNAVAEAAGKVKHYLEQREPTAESIPLKSEREAEFVESCLHLSELAELQSLSATVLVHRTADGPCLTVTADKQHIQEAVGVVQKQLAAIIVEKHEYGRAGEVKILEKHRATVRTRAQERRCGLFLSQKPPVAPALPLSFTHRIGKHMSLSITEGALQHLAADALLCPLDSKLGYSDPVIQAVLHFRGASITDMCGTQKSPQPGEVLLGSTGRLSTGMLLLAVLPQKGQPRDSQCLQSAICNSLRKAEEHSCSSIALPPVGCGNFGFSITESCTAIRAAVLQFSQDSPKNLRNVTIVAPDQKTVEEFNTLIKELGFPLQSLKRKHRSDRRVLINGVQILLKKGDITREAADVIVNSTNKTLDLNTGVSGAIFKAAGKSVVAECKKRAPLPAGGVLLTSAGDLQCHSIAQMVGPENITDITHSLGKILDLCDEKQARSLAIPAIGTGRGGFTPKDSMWAMLAAMQTHLTEPNSSTLSRITVLALQQDTFQAFRHCFKEWNQPTYGKMPESQVKIGNTRIEVKKGSITNESVRGIVNTTNRDMSLRGGVSGAIFKAAGASVEQECQKHGPLQGDDAAVTAAGLLHSDLILHMLGPHSAEESRTRVRKVLERCEEKQITTVSFPAIGTGGGGVQAVDAVAAMLQGFADHLTKSTSSVVKLIYIVIDRDSILQEFLDGLKTWRANAQASRDEEDDEDEEEEEDDEVCSSSSDPEADEAVEVFLGPLTVRVSSGDITKEKVEAVVNSTNTSLNLSSGVSGAILKASGSKVVKECKAKAPQPADGVVLTRAGNLTNCTHIVHMVGQTSRKGIRSSMAKVLKTCEENHIQSISFPALGTGAGHLPAAAVADAMTTALTDFVKDLPKHLKRVHIVIFQRKLLPDFQKAVRSCRRMMASAGQVKPLQTHKPPPALCLARETAAVSFPMMEMEVYGTSRTQLAEVTSLLDDLLSEESERKDLQSRHITDLTESDAEAVVSLSRAMQVRVQMESLEQLTVSGRREEVLEAALKISLLLQEAQERAARRAAVQRLQDTLSWELLAGERWTPIDPSVSYDIELAFHSQQKSFQFQQDGDTLTVDFSHMELRSSTQETARIKRSLRGDSDTAIIHPPPTWTKMDGRDLEVVALQCDSEEYKKIEAEFVQSSKHPDVSPVQVQQIDRIQSQSQWQRYSVLKQAVDKKYPTQSNERLLYHGTTREICQKINKNGFNRSFCGRNAVAHGDGTYFAREAWYSCQDRYSSVDGSGLQCVYRARVVTGAMCKSRAGMKEPEPLDAADPQAGLHDCAVDSLQKPFIFVVFCDAGAYPEYLITFKSI
ncbi:protein mono-ADP-ribosyltransferase PARP14-like isoform X2 [Danio aesculapii]|uniref:protein mono-ADP-ribosyltransferase PARP14-like isoform X2 n=1 Tax=Danio aesculapii TaxID=1142201 RepID=UPI0024BF5BAB|nr:protein mono-ADP-ribosyltransferase PARP14-like isoform X2 [Danio aesculapii]